MLTNLLRLSNSVQLKRIQLAGLFVISGLGRLQGRGLLYHSSFDFLDQWSR